MYTYVWVCACACVWSTLLPFWVHRISVINSEIVFSLRALRTGASQKGRMSTAGIRKHVLKRGKLMHLATRIVFKYEVVFKRPPLWSSGQSFWLQIQRFRVRFPALLDFLSSSGSGTGPLSLVRSN